MEKTEHNQLNEFLIFLCVYYGVSEKKGRYGICFQKAVCGGSRAVNFKAPVEILTSFHMFLCLSIGSIKSRHLNFFHFLKVFN